MIRKVLLIVLVIGVVIGQAEEAKSGWSWGGVPAVAYNSDNGFTYGIILQPFHYGDGSMYPDYLFSIYSELSRTTKGGGVNKLFFDSKYLMPRDIRVTSELSLLTEKLLPFYGFNGYHSEYRQGYEIEDSTDAYISRTYYRHAREQFRFTADFQKQIVHPKVRGILGLGFLNTTTGNVDVADINDKADDETTDLPAISGSTYLFEKYLQNDWIPDEEADGGATNYLKLGLVYDSRDQEANPMSGMWTEALITVAPEFLGTETPYTLLTLTHRQYFTLIENDLSFAYRLGYQGNISGQAPFYMLPFYMSSYKMEEGLGGSKSLRGILKNRIVGNATYFTNLEFRWKFFRTVVGGQNLYLALNGFTDIGQVLTPYEVEGETLPEVSEEGVHVAYGAGFRIALNENFIVAIDYGMAKDPQDGNAGMYIGLGYLY